MYRHTHGTVIALIINDMDKSHNIRYTIEPQTTKGADTVRCKLFSDSISRHLCELRRRELNASGIFSCEGCIALNIDVDVDRKKSM